MNRLFSRWLPCITLATWSAVLTGIYFSGRVREFLTPEFRIGVLLAGIAMGVMALVFLFFPADASCCSSAECGHSLTRQAWGKVLTFLILLLPITAAAMFSPDSFSASVMNNRGVITDASGLARTRTAPQPPPELPLPTKDAAPPATAENPSTPPPPAPAPQH